MAVGGAEQHLDGAVGRAGLPLRRERRERDVGLERRAQLLREGRDPGVAGDSVGGRVPQLALPVRRLAAGGERLSEENDVHPDRG